MAAAVDFYQLTYSTAEEAVPLLLAKALERGGKALVCCRGERFNPLSTAIWSGRQDSWLPHGIRGRDEDDAGLCPIWITDDAADNPNGASFHFFLDGIEPPMESPAERLFVLFEGRDKDAVAAARGQWKAFHGAKRGELSFWQQDKDGRWERKAADPSGGSG